MDRERATVDIDRELHRIRVEHPDTWQQVARGRAEAWEISAQRQPDSLIRSAHTQRAADWRRAIATVLATV